MRIGVRIQVVAAILSGKSFSKRTAGSFRYSINSNFYNKTAKISLKLTQILRLGSINYTHTLFTCLGCDKLLRD